MNPKRLLATALHRSGLLGLRGVVQRGRIGIILTYHRISDDDDPFFPSLDVASFEAQLDLVRSDYRVETVAGLTDWLRDGPPGPPRVALTFDDGYLSTHEIALPRLRRRGLPATLFLATDPPECGRLLWLDRLRLLLRDAPAARLDLAAHGLGPWPLATRGERLAALGRVIGRLKQAGAQEIEDVVGGLWTSLGGDAIVTRPAPLSWPQVREIAEAGIDIGGHTHRHYVLSRLSRDAARHEIARGLELIRARVGTEPAGFAYPNGSADDYGPVTLDLLSELRVPWACTTQPGFATTGVLHDRPHELPRIYTAMDTLSLFACRLAGLTRLRADEPSGAVAH